MNLVSGPHSRSERDTRLTKAVDWTKDLIRRLDGVSRVVIFAHPYPGSSQRKFFDPLTEFIEDDLRNQVPILYVNGDKHKFLYEPNFYNQSSFFRIMVQAHADDPPLKITVNANDQWVPGQAAPAFPYDRGLQ